MRMHKYLKYFLVLCLGFLLPALSFAGGEHNTPGGSAVSGASATAGAIAAGVGIGIGGAGGSGIGTGTGTGGSASANVSTGKNIAIGLGSTGLTSTAPMQGSESFLFNLYSHTYTDPGAVHRYYTFVICTRAVDENKCFFEMACMDPDLKDDVKNYIQCKPEQPVAGTDNPGKTAFAQGQ